MFILNVDKNRLTPNVKSFSTKIDQSNTVSRIFSKSFATTKSCVGGKRVNAAFFFDLSFLRINAVFFFIEKVKLVNDWIWIYRSSV